MNQFATACILSYERPHFLREAITTLVETANYPVEIIVHDDGSKDPAVRSLLLDALDKGLVSTVMFNPLGRNQGQGTALNRMFTMAKGDPIVKLDQDLIFQPDWLRRCVDVLSTNSSRVISGEVEPPIGVLGLFKYPAEPVRYEEMFIRDHGPAGLEWEEHHDFVGSGMVVPREVWEAFGPFEEYSTAFAEDRAFKMKVKDEGGLALGLIRGDDLAINQGFGVGPSTVVVDHGKVAHINTEPYVIGGEAEGESQHYVRNMWDLIGGK